MINLQYLAGFIDGEGWIGIYKSKANGKQQKTDRFTLEVGIGQTLKGLDLFKVLEEQFEGRISFYQPKNGNAQPQCKFVITGDKARKLLIQIEPYLILKRTQAQIAIKFQEDKNLTNLLNNSFRGKLMPVEIRDKREKVYLDMKILNKKGVL